MINYLKNEGEGCVDIFIALPDVTAPSGGPFNSVFVVFLL